MEWIVIEKKKKMKKSSMKEINLKKKFSELNLKKILNFYKICIKLLIFLEITIFFLIFSCLTSKEFT